ncbi:predicted competence protein ComK [Alteracholeplasma palmae J233]|uniref:Predicted competence protein ComK n=1 Tax=Alteracholeplasma palmae (strain ATCC 49389 / J233) TaxID=1318466 RepID=U4KNN5_ALTPJ|nr:competence protein ComK [Alteracholeplasma palmae]CCV63810.1 predicted competence protein ComK [Alteracholeplasma palmae J233]
MDYIINTHKGCKVFDKNNKEYPVTQLTYVKKLCEKQLFTYEGYLKAVSNILNMKYKIPLYINSKIILFSTSGYRNYENIWINYQTIKTVDFYEKTILFTFFSQQILRIQMTKCQYQRQIEKINKIIAYKLSDKID